MKRVYTILSVSGLVLALSLPGWAQTQTLPTHTVTINGTVETIDHAKHIMNIKTSDGNTSRLTFPRTCRSSMRSRLGTRCR